MNKVYIAITTAIVAIGALVMLNITGTDSQAIRNVRDCDNNSIVYCGALSQAELIKKYDENKNDMQKIYAHYGITRDDITGKTSQVKIGKIYRDGRVEVDGKIVATGAHSVGRQTSKNSKKVTINGKTYYERTDATGIPANPGYIDAFVLMRDGKFYRAIMTSCGNPTVAKAVEVPKYACDGLTATKLSRTEYRFNAKASASGGATVSKYTFDFGDGKKATQTGATVNHTYEKAGTYKAKVSVEVKVGSTTKTVTSSKCEVTIKVEEKPAEPKYACEGLGMVNLTRTSFRFTASASASNGATISKYNFDFGDGKTASQTGTSVEHNYEKAGTYKIKVSVEVKVNGQTKTVTGPNCETTIKVEEKPAEPVYACDGLAARVIKLEDRSYAYDLAYTAKNGASLKDVDFNFGDGQVATYTEAQLKDINHTYEQAGSYKTTATLHFAISKGNSVEVKDVKCETAISTAPDACPLNPAYPKDDERCTPCEVPGKEQYPKDSPFCAETPKTPETPKELPKTGLGELLSGTLGLGALVASIGYYVASRRALLNR